MPAPDPNRGLKLGLTVMLMIPPLIAVGVGVYTLATDGASGVPFLASGLVLTAFNVFILRMYFQRLAAGGDQDTPA